MDLVTITKVGYLTQAIWRLQAAKALVDMAASPFQQQLVKQIDSLIESVEADVAEMHDPVDR